MSAKSGIWCWSGDQMVWVGKAHIKCPGREAGYAVRGPLYGYIGQKTNCLFFGEVRRPARVELWGCGRKTNVVGSARVCAHTGCVSVGIHLHSSAKL